VPFEPVIHETLDSRVFTNIPDTRLTGGIHVQQGDEQYTAELEVEGTRPGTAKALAVELVEKFLAVLASWNHGFQIRIGGVRSEVVESTGTVAVEEVASGLIGVTALDTMYIEDHVQAVVQKANLDAEDAFFQRFNELPDYVRSCLELNYLLVLSTRPPNRWLLAATGLEALAIGTIGAQQTVSNRLTSEARRQLQREITPAIDAARLDDLAERITQRVLSTTVGPVANHVHSYLLGVGIADTSPDEINRWWRTRGTIAHGGAVDINNGDLNHLITVFQTALRRTAKAEELPSI
jgi:hypothetical protein